MSQRGLLHGAGHLHLHRGLDGLRLQHADVRGGGVAAAAAAAAAARPRRAGAGAAAEGGVGVAEHGGDGREEAEGPQGKLAEAPVWRPVRPLAGHGVSQKMGPAFGQATGQAMVRLEVDGEGPILRSEGEAQVGGGLAQLVDVAVHGEAVEHFAEAVVLRRLSKRRRKRCGIVRKMG